MGMKEEITSIARSLGYTGPTPASKTKAVHAVAEVADNAGGGGGGEAGYDVTITKEWVFEEQTATSYAIEVTDGQAYVANVTLADSCDFAQMYAAGKTALKLMADGVETDVTLISDPAGYAIVTDPQDLMAGLSIMMQDETWTIGLFPDAEPTAHTVSCWYQGMSVTTTEVFDMAVAESVGKSSDDGAVSAVVIKEGPNWTCSVSAQEMYAAMLQGKPVDMTIIANGYVYKVTDLDMYLSGMTASTAEYTGHFWSLDETSNVLTRGFVHYDYASDTITGNLSEKAYQLTPAS